MLLDIEIFRFIENYLHFVTVFRFEFHGVLTSFQNVIGKRDLDIIR